MAQRRPPAQSSSPPPSALAAVGGGIIGGTPSAAAGATALVSGAQAQKSAVASAIRAIASLLALIHLRRRKMIEEAVLARYPKTDIGDALAEEERREVVFRKRSQERVRAGMTLAQAAKDPSARASAIQNVMNRERRFAEQRSAAAGERVLVAAELQELRKLSPRGAFWALGVRRTHTPDCIAMAGKFWPWEVLERVHPLLHTGCGCQLFSFGDALNRGLMRAGDVMKTSDAVKLAGPVIQHVEEEKAEAARKYGPLAESALNELLAREALLLRGGDADLLAATPLGCDAELFPAQSDGNLIEAEERHNKGAMVALYPDPTAAKKLALKGGSKPEELHVTLAFLGKDATALPFNETLAAVQAWAKKTPILKGEMSGVGHFDIGGGDKVTYRSVDLPELPAPREELVKALDAAGAPAMTDHGFTPHMTVDEKIRRPQVKKEPVTFRKVTLAWGEDHHEFPLAGKAKSD